MARIEITELAASPIDVLGLPVRAYNALRRSGYVTSAIYLMSE